MPQILFTSLAAVIISQLSKLLFNSNNLKLNRHSLYSYSGMPSSHAAMTVSLATITGLTEGFNSPLFAVTVVFTILVIRDALGLRRYIGQHGEIINDLIRDLKKDKIGLAEKYPRLIEKIGHTPAQVMAGSLIGLAISLISFYLV